MYRIQCYNVIVPLGVERINLFMQRRVFVIVIVEVYGALDA